MDRPQAEAFIAAWKQHELPFARAPRLLMALPAGSTNNSYLVQGDGKLCVLRLAHAAARALGVNREHEDRAQAAAAAAGIAPAILWADTDSGNWLSDYVADTGKVTAATPGVAVSMLRETLAMMRDINAGLPPFDYRAAVLRLRAPASTLPEEIEAAIALLEACPARGLCHHDLNSGNVRFRADRAVLLDWEYAGFGVPLMDEAALLVHWQAGVRDINAAPELIDAAVRVYRELCELWNLRHRELATPSRQI